MNRKWIGLLAAAAAVAAFGLAGNLSLAQDEKHKENETALGKLMEKVQKRNSEITKFTRNANTFKKSQKELQKAAADMYKLAKDAKPLKEGYTKNAKNEANPEKKWDEIMDAFVKTSKDFSDLVVKDTTTQKDAKDSFQSVKKTCSDCHTVFRVESEF
ncbi:MAG: cytochrome c [Isosphaeraceae bacterium]